MAVYADTPRWPRHGTVWGHLVSDSSLEELHAAAAASALHPRSFDLDHYDWPEPARPALAAAGVRFVGNGELTRILLRSGLRIPAARRAAATAARTRADAQRLGLARAPLELIWGERGHVGPLCARPGSFRVTRNRGEEARIESRDPAGARAASELLSELDRAARAAAGERWIGQARGLAAR